MTIQIVPINENFSGVTGVYQGQAEKDPLFLGETKLSKLIEAVSNGRIAIGFDTRISPAQVRIFYDKGGAIISGTAPTKCYGLVVTTEIRFDGLPVQPGTYAPGIGFQNDYSNFIPTPFNYTRGGHPPSPAYAVDMMSPDLLRAKQIADPYFPYNAVCYQGEMNEDEVYSSIYAPNGFMATLPPLQSPQAPLCASLVAPIGLDIDAPFLSEVMGRLDLIKKEEIEPVATYEKLEDTEYRQGKLLVKILNALGIEPQDLLRVQMVGSYPLLTVMGDEGWYPVLIADPSDRKIYQLDSNDIDQVRFMTTCDRFERFVDFYIANERINPNFPSRPGPYYLRTYGAPESTKTMRSGKDHCIACNYKVYFVGKGSVTTPTKGSELTYDCIGGVQWSVQRKFDKTAMEFDPPEYTTPVEIALHDLIRYNWELEYTLWGPKKDKGKAMPELANFLNAMKSNATGNVDQEQWFMTYPPLDPSIPAI